jgi:hypothetical protein
LFEKLTTIGSADFSGRRKMKFRVINEPWILRGYIPELVAIAGVRRWEKRVSHLRESAQSPYLAKIAADYHWLELQLEDELAKRKNPRTVAADDDFNPISRRALRFAQTIAEAHKSLPAEGQRKLEGRVRDALQAETGFAALYQEMEIAAALLNDNFEVGFPDLDGTGRADISFQRGGVDGLLECKALSADAGRKIHRKHFYRFMNSISEDILQRASAGENVLIIITLKDRLISNLQRSTPLVQATKDIAQSDQFFQVTGDDFHISCERYAQRFEMLPPMSETEFSKEAQSHFGPNCHVAGVRVGRGSCFLVMRSEREDDHSKPQLEAMKEAAEQLSGDRPGFIALQLNEISSADLALPHLRRRSALLCNYVFHETQASHIAAVYISAFGAISVAADSVAYPALALWNPRCRFDIRGLPFRVGLPYEAFSKLLN